MKLLSIDPASSTGFSIFEDGKLIDYGFFKPTGDLNNKLYEIYDYFYKLLQFEHFNNVVVEDFKVGKFASAAESGYSIRAMFRLMCKQEQTSHHVINVTDWHKYLVGITQAKKADKAELGKDALKIITKRKILSLYDVSETCTNRSSNRVSTTPYDVYDSIGIGHYFLETNK